ncbi:MAG: TetR/AcrR family transcriptional regulator [Syntrophobacteraceae bacterium]
MFKQGLEDKKNFIAEIAAKVFGKKGYMSSSLQEVALEANMSKAGLYHYFKSKEELLAYILLRNTDFGMQVLRARIEANSEKNLSPEESFRSLIHTYASQVNQDKDLRSIVLRERHQLSTEHKKELFTREQEIFRLLRDELKKIPDLENDLDLNVITFLFISMSHWLGYWFREGEKLDMPGIIDQNILAIFYGILEK